MVHKTKLLIIGAGPYGLALGLYAQRHQLDYLITGELMGFWQSHMPRGMQLRTPFDWYDEQQLAVYLQTHGLKQSDIKPVPRELFIDYIRWSVKQHRLNIDEQLVKRLDSTEQTFRAQLANGDIVLAERVVIATGYYAYKHIPEELQVILPSGRYAHNADCVDFQQMQGKRCLVIGGRQGAFEWAGLLSDYAARVDIVYRHGTPQFTPSNWSWVYPLIEKTRQDPGWFRRLAQDEKEALEGRCWFEGRAQLEDWLLDKCRRDNVKLWPNTAVTGCQVSANGDLRIDLDNGQCIDTDQLVLATGFRVDVKKLPLLEQGNVLERLQCVDGYPVLDEALQSNIPGLYFTGIHAVKDFGPLFFFVACAFAAAGIIGGNLRHAA